MVIIPNVSLSVLELAIAICVGLIGMGSAFIGGLWYFSLDRKTSEYDDDIRDEIVEDDAFRGIVEASYPKFVTTSASSISRLTSFLQVIFGRLSETPYKFVVVEGDTIEERKIEIIRERCREIPGKIVLNPEVVAAIRNHYSYKLALASEDVSSDVAEHFKEKFESYEFSNRVNELADSANFPEISLDNDSDNGVDRDALNDVFLPIVRLSERWCIRPISDIDEKRKAIDRCQGLLMLTFFGLYTQSMKGMLISEEIETDDCISAYNVDIRDEDSWGYWIIPVEDCDEGEFRRLRYISSRISQIIDDYWDDTDKNQLHPPGETIRDMEYVERPFWLFQKDEEVFRGGGSPN